ncbi:MAG: thiamine pyrophosphate-binding protein [Gammaproteobacteria bacterium]|nr:thiamine pyrophosphate-binding protein [Gammaproteobacteria bacterium]
MAVLDGGRLLVKTLKREGVKQIFTLSGGHIEPVHIGCIDEGIRIIDVRHEQVAGHAAAGWARATGEPGVAVVTAGPGVTDAVTGIAEAFYSESPIIVIGGQTRLSQIDMGAPQNLPHVRMLEPITKWATTIYETHRIPEYLSRAYRLAMSGTPGPVYLEAPLDALFQELEEDTITYPPTFSATQSGASPDHIEQAMAFLAAAERPLVVAGTGVWSARVDNELLEFAERTQVPVWMFGEGRGALPETHPLSVGMFAVPYADLLLVIGTKCDYMLAYGQPPLVRDDAKVIQVHTDETVIGFNRSVDIGIAANPKIVLGQLNQALEDSGTSPDQSAWHEELKAIALPILEQAEKEYGSDSTPMHPARLSREVVEFLDDDAIVVPDGGDISYGYFGPCFKAQTMGQVMLTGPLGCLGTGTGFAMAAKLAHPDKQVLLFSGDGTFGLNGMEFDTFVRHDLPVVCVVANDSAWGMVKHVRRMMAGDDKLAGSELAQNTRYEKVVQALGGYGEFVDDVNEVKPALKRAFDSGLPACINVAVRQDVWSAATEGYKNSWGLAEAADS